MSFKWIFAALTFACMFYFLVKVRRAVVQRLFVIAFFGAAVVFVLQPELATRLANALGIGRGADLILYVSTLFLFFLCFNLYLRFRTTEEQLTTVVRHTALMHPVRVEPPSSERAGDAATDS